MADLAKYYTERNYPPGEIPGGTRWYTEEEVSAYRCWLTGCRLTNRQLSVVKKLLAEIDARTESTEEKELPPRVVMGDYYAGPVYRFGGVSAVVVLIILAYLSLLAWFAFTIAREFFAWNGRHYGLGFLLIGGGVGLIYHLVTWGERIGAKDDDTDWPETL